MILDRMDVERLIKAKIGMEKVKESLQVQLDYHRTPTDAILEELIDQFSRELGKDIWADHELAMNTKNPFKGKGCCDLM